MRTREGRLVNLEGVADALRTIPDVQACVVLPVEGSAGTAVGAVLQCAGSETFETLRTRIAAAVPVWGLPRRVVVVHELPRLQTGKPDRLSCLGLLSVAPAKG